jgi:hypothetical protein
VVGGKVTVFPTNVKLVCPKDGIDHPPNAAASAVPVSEPEPEQLSPLVETVNEDDPVPVTGRSFPFRHVKVDRPENVTFSLSVNDWFAVMVIVPVLPEPDTEIWVIDAELVPEIVQVVPVMEPF